MNKNILITLVLVLIVGAGSFYAGIKYQQSKIPTRGQFVQRFGGPDESGTNMGFQPVNGEIISSDDNSITVKLQDGSSKIILLSDSTIINKSESGSKEDLKTGEKVMVSGDTNSDGSISAQTIQLNPMSRATLR